jgi:hypothetical protein
LAKFCDFCCVAFARELYLLRRRINSLNFNRPAAFDQQFGECPISTTDVCALQAGWQLQPVEKILTDASAPDSHRALVSGAVIKSDDLIGHGVSPR